MRKGKKKGRYFAFAVVWRGEKKAKACKGGWESTFTRSIITPECGRNMIKKRKSAKTSV